MLSAAAVAAADWNGWVAEACWLCIGGVGCVVHAERVGRMD